MEIPEIAKNNSRKKKQELSDAELLKQTAEGVVEITRILSDMSRDLRINAMNRRAFVPSFLSDPFFPNIPSAPVSSPVYHKPENMFQNAAFSSPRIVKYADLQILNKDGSMLGAWALCWKKPYGGLPISADIVKYFIERADERPDNFLARTDINDFYRLTIRLAILFLNDDATTKPHVLDIVFKPVPLEMIVGEGYPMRHIFKVAHLINQRATSTSYATMPVTEIKIGQHLAVNNDAVGQPETRIGCVYIGYKDATGEYTEASCDGVEFVKIIETKEGD